MSAEKISRVINPDTISRKMNRASPCPAAVEARAGHNGKLSNISCLIRSYLIRSCPTRCCRDGFCLTRTGVIPTASLRRQFLQAEQNQQQAAHDHNCETTAQSQNVAHDGAVFSGCRGVVIAVEQHLIDRVA